MTPILFDEGGAGFALKNGDIVSVFKHPKSNLGSALNAVIPLAIQLGGNRLDCFSKGLPAMYAKFGFLPVAKIQSTKNMLLETGIMRVMVSRT